MNILGSLVPLENCHSSFTNTYGMTNSNANMNDNSAVNSHHQANANRNGNKTSFLIDDILFPAKLRAESTRQVNNSSTLTVISMFQDVGPLQSAHLF